MHLIHLVYKRPCFLKKNTAVQVPRQGLKTNKQEQETNKQRQTKKMGEAVHKNVHRILKTR